LFDGFLRVYGVRVDPKLILVADFSLIENRP